MGSAALFTQLMDGSCEHGREILSKIALELKHEVANQGVVVMQAGEYGNSMYLVGDGEVEIYRRATEPSEIRLAIGERPPLEANNRVRLGRLGPRGFFGELAVMRSGGSFGGIDAAEATSKVRHKPGWQASIPVSRQNCAKPILGPRQHTDVRTQPRRSHVHRAPYCASMPMPAVCGADANCDRTHRVQLPRAGEERAGEAAWRVPCSAPGDAQHREWPRPAILLQGPAHTVRPPCLPDACGISASRAVENAVCMGAGVRVQPRWRRPEPEGWRVGGSAPRRLTCTRRTGSCRSFGCSCRT